MVTDFIWRGNASESIVQGHFKNNGVMPFSILIGALCDAASRGSVLDYSLLKSVSLVMFAGFEGWSFCFD